MPILVLLSIYTLAIAALKGLKDLSFIPKVTDADYDDAPDKLVSVIIPICDEERNAAKCLGA